MRGLASACERTVDGGIGLLVLFTPLAFGSVETWAILALETAVFAIGAAWLAGKALRGGVLTRRRRSSEQPRTVPPQQTTVDELDLALRIGYEREARGSGNDRAEAAGGREAETCIRRTGSGLAIPILLFIGVVLFQLVPLPRALLSFLAPRTSVLYQRTVPGYEQGAGLGFEDWLLAADAARSEGTAPSVERGNLLLPVSHAPHLTRNMLALFCAYGLLFFVAVDRFRERARRSRLVVWIAFVGVGVAIVGIFQKLTWNGKVLWFRTPAAMSRPFGPFINSNHFAGYMELIVPLGLGLLLTLLWQGLPRSLPGGDHREPHGAPRPRRDGGEGSQAVLLPWMTTNTLPKAVLLGFPLALSIGSMVLSLSRGGLLAMMLTFAVFARALVPEELASSSRARVVAIGLASLAGVLGLTFWLGASSIVGRAAALADATWDASYGGRLDTWLRTLTMFRDHALLGTGLGSYSSAFNGYYPAGTIHTWEQAHNDYVQFLAEVGLAGLIPALMALYVFMRRHYVPAVLDRRRPDRYLLLGLSMAILSMLLHSFVDFNLQVPAIALLFVLLAALLTASSAHDERQDPDVPVSPPGRKRLMYVACAAALLCAAVGTVFQGARRVRASRLAWQLTIAKERTPDLMERVEQMAKNRPSVLSSFADSALVAFDDWWTFGGVPEAEARAELQRAEKSYRELVSMTPLWSWGWWGLGVTYARRSDLARSAAPKSIESLFVASEKDLPRDARLSAAALRTSLLLEPNSYTILDDLARLYRDEGLRSAGLEAFRASARIMPLYDRHAYRSPQDLPEEIYEAIVEGMEDALADPGLMDVAAIRQDLGEIAGDRGDLVTAERQFRLGIAAATSDLMRGVLSLELGEVLRRRNEVGEAIPWLERATDCPAVAWRAWLALGEVHDSQGDHTRAIEDFRTAIELAPDEDFLQVREARAMIQMGDRSGAIKKLKDVIRALPPGLEARELLVQTLREEGRLGEALEEARALSALASDNAGYRRVAADLAREQEGATAPAAR